MSVLLLEDCLGDLPLSYFVLWLDLMSWYGLLCCHDVGLCGCLVFGGNLLFVILCIVFMCLVWFGFYMRCLLVLWILLTWLLDFSGWGFDIRGGLLICYVFAWNCLYWLVLVTMLMINCLDFCSLFWLKFVGCIF